MMACASFDSDCDIDIIHYAVTVYEKEILEQLQESNCFNVFINEMRKVISPQNRGIAQTVYQQDHQHGWEYCWSEFMKCKAEDKYRELWELAQQREKLKNILMLNPLTPQHRKQENYWRMLIDKHLKDLKEIPLQGSEILQNLLRLNTITDIAMQRIEKKLKNEGAIVAIYDLVDVLPTNHEKWYFHFLLVLYKEGLDIAETLEPNIVNLGIAREDLDMSEQEVETIIAIVRPGGMSEEAEENDDREDLEGEKEKLGDEPTSMADTDSSGFPARRDGPEGAESTDNFSSSEFQPHQDEAVESRELVLRDYQEKLAEPGVEGKNNIVFAPTGSGKTIVAVRIALEHMRSREAGSRKMAFLVPTKPLADQQAAIFSKYMGQEFRVRDLIGGEGASMSLPLSKIMEEYDIIVMTAQVLVNALKTDYYQLESVRVFSLIIFDECHHCDKGHPYNEIMISYFNEREAGHKDLPQIVGLTASFGTNKADKLDKALKHVLASCARLDSTAPPKLVDISENYLTGWCESPDDEVIVCNPKSPDYAGTRLEKLMAIIEEKIKEIYNRATGGGDVSGLLIPSVRGSTIYTSFVNGDLKQFRISLHGEEDRKVMNMAITYLNVCNRALILSRLVRSQDAREYVMKELGELSPQTEFESETKKKLEDEFREAIPKEKNPALEKLKEIITKQFQTEPNSRALIFVKEREYVTAIIDFFHDELPDHPVDSVVGAQAAADKGGQNQNRQKAVLNNFREGVTKILVCTSVLEEGLDVPECNLVIRYSHVTNETAMIQSKGRGRSKDARYIVIVPADEKWLERKEHLNKFRSSMMVEATRNVTNLSETDYREQIQRIQKEELQMRFLKEQTQKLLNDEKRGKRYRLLCIHCNTFVCFSDDVRKAEGAHHLVICDEILEKLTVDTKTSLEFALTTFVGSIHCAKCNFKWGPVIYFRNVAFPSIAVKNFILSFEANPKLQKTVKRWKSVPFIVEDITLEDITECFKRRKNLWVDERQIG